MEPRRDEVEPNVVNVLVKRLRANVIEAVAGILYERERRMQAYLDG